MVFGAFAQISLWGVLAAAAFGFVFGGVYFGALVPRYYAMALGREAMPVAKLDMLTTIGPFRMQHRDDRHDGCNHAHDRPSIAYRCPVARARDRRRLSPGDVYDDRNQSQFPQAVLLNDGECAYFLVNMLVTSAVLFLLQ
jgi:hypothetical protein